MSAKVEQPAGNFYDKYNTRNPISRALMQGFLRGFEELVAASGAIGDALEIGCGEGELSMRLARAGWSVEGCDIAQEAIDEATRRVAAAGLSIPLRQLDIRDAATAFQPVDLVVCCEVLEHLEDPASAFRTLLGLSRRYVLVSVPREPVWRAMNMARGKYWADLGNTPGHIQHWSKSGFLSMLREQAEVVEVRSPLPWTQALCRAR